MQALTADASIGAMVVVGPLAHPHLDSIFTAQFAIALRQLLAEPAHRVLQGAAAGCAHAGVSLGIGTASHFAVLL